MLSARPIRSLRSARLTLSVRPRNERISVCKPAPFSRSTVRSCFHPGPPPPTNQRHHQHTTSPHSAASGWLCGPWQLRVCEAENARNRTQVRGCEAKNRPATPSKARFIHSVRFCVISRLWCKSHIGGGGGGGSYTIHCMCVMLFVRPLGLTNCCSCIRTKFTSHLCSLPISSVVYLWNIFGIYLSTTNYLFRHKLFDVCT